jgi:hypothetical protein
MSSATGFREPQQCPAARYRNRLIVTTPSRACRRANAATGDAHELPEASGCFSPMPSWVFARMARIPREREADG